MDNVQCIDIFNKYKIGVVVSGADMYVEIGDYSTEAKAIKILNSICGRHDATPVSNWTFEMPSDEEVEG
jgi:hypothetical protein